MLRTKARPMPGPPCEWLGGALGLGAQVERLGQQARALLDRAAGRSVHDDAVQKKL
jgi:hypothetical protein